ncbi:hypothetical protein T4A_1549 [Trichinella pseudospiralis]|uniref:Uncharacterized protein n=1 Tax=Trichinella pseudospiralis TaxID=6337 RepID=A0A0V1JM37_TRIPS|nr:hypothetical protein T4A_1549 [Trichinella pseudospiralis]KRZ36030.1 hypothetical protein T4C_1869 [Trichinella pseudospiralis]
MNLFVCRYLLLPRSYGIYEIINDGCSLLFNICINEQFSFLDFNLSLKEVEIEQILHRCSPRTGPTRKTALSNTGLLASQPTK